MCWIVEYQDVPQVWNRGSAWFRRLLGLSIQRGESPPLHAASLAALLILGGTKQGTGIYETRGSIFLGAVEN